MRPGVEAEILARFAAPREAAPPEAPGRARGDVYAGAGRARREARSVFDRSWVPLVREDALDCAGAFRCVDLAGVPLICVRDGDGVARVLENVCAHRAAQIVRTEAGVTDALACPYHGFRYGLDGVLQSCPLPESLDPDARPGRLALRERGVARFGGWLWTGPFDGPPLDAFLGDELRDELRNWPLADLTVVHVVEHEAAFDWKVGVEAFLEPYHVPAIHARSAHPVVDLRGIAVRDLSPHSRMALPFRLPGIFGPDGALGAPASAAGVGVFPALNDAQRCSHLVYLVFPCTIWMLFPNHALALRFLPDGVERCRVRWELLAAPPTGEAAEAWRQGLVPGYEALVREDLENLPWIQRGVRSGHAGPLRLSGYESRVGMFRDAYASALGGPSEAGGER